MDIIYELKKFGINEVVLHILSRLGIVDKHRLYEAKCKYYYKLSTSDYEHELKEWYSKNGGRDNIDDPQTFNGKIQWLKIHDSIPMKTTLADKYLVREWIKQKIGAQYLIDLLGIYDKFEEIDFNVLPSQFVIKANHGSGMNIIVKDKHAINMKYVKKQINQWMNTIFGYEGMETHYFNIPRKILIEEFIEQLNGDLYDYKIHCFNGQAKYIQLIGDRNLETHSAFEAFFDLDWNMKQFHYTYPKYKTKIEKPQKLTEMIKIANELCIGFKYVRVDLYLISEKIKFGEMTFTPANGMDKWDPPETDFELGRLLDLNK